MNAETCDVRISAADYQTLHRHLFPGDRDEHGAVLAAGVSQVGDKTSLIVRDIYPARAGSDYVEGKIGYRALHPSFIHQRIIACRDSKLAYIAVHNHDCDRSVDFSDIDMASHERGYPALLGIGKGVPVGAMVFGRRSAEADFWFADNSRKSLGVMTIVGDTIERLTPTPYSTEGDFDLHDRQVRMFGAAGQAILRDAKVAVIGLGGVGSLVSEYLARLGVGELLLIDPDRIEASNLSRVVGARADDVSNAVLKTEIARRVAHEAGSTAVLTIDDDVASEAVALELRSCDFIFLAADSMRARLVVNALVHQYFIPAVQLGAKIRAGASAKLDEAMSAVRQIRPRSGCLWCNQLIDPGMLAIEAKSDEERVAQAYGTHAPNPSVITLNAVAAAHGVNEFLFDFLGIERRQDRAPFQHFHALKSQVSNVEPRADEHCRECGWRYGMADGVSLPVLSR